MENSVNWHHVVVLGGPDECGFFAEEDGVDLECLDSKGQRCWDMQHTTARYEAPRIYVDDCTWKDVSGTISRVRGHVRGAWLFEVGAAGTVIDGSFTVQWSGVPSVDFKDVYMYHTHLSSLDMLRQPSELFEDARQWFRDWNRELEEESRGR